MSTIYILALQPTNPSPTLAVLAPDSAGQEIEVAIRRFSEYGPARRKETVTMDRFGFALLQVGGFLGAHEASVSINGGARCVFWAQDRSRLFFTEIIHRRPHEGGELVRLTVSADPTSPERKLTAYLSQAGQMRSWARVQPQDGRVDLLLPPGGDQQVHLVRDRGGRSTRISLTPTYPSSGELFITRKGNEVLLNAEVREARAVVVLRPRSTKVLDKMAFRASRLAGATTRGFAPLMVLRGDHAWCSWTADPVAREKGLDIRHPHPDEVSPDSPCPSLAVLTGELLDGQARFSLPKLPAADLLLEAMVFDGKKLILDSCVMTDYSFATRRPAEFQALDLAVPLTVDQWYYNIVNGAAGTRALQVLFQRAREAGCSKIRLEGDHLDYGGKGELYTIPMGQHEVMGLVSMLQRTFGLPIGPSASEQVLSGQVEGPDGPLSLKATISLSSAGLRLELTHFEK